MGLRRWVTTTSIAIIVAVAAYTGYWFYAAGLARDRIARWTEEQGRRGVDVAYEAIETGGFPFLLTATLARPRARSSGDSRWDWSGPTVTLSIRPWRLSEITFSAPGQHRILLVGPARAREISVRTTKADGLARIGRSGIAEEILVGLTDVVASDSGVETTFERIEARVAPMPRTPPLGAANPSQPTVAELLVRASGTTLPMDTALGRRIESVVAEITVHGALRSAPSWTESLAAWRDDGGTLEIKSCRARWDQLDLAFDATLALDHDLQPIGAGRATIRGFAETIDAFARGGLLRPAEAALAKFGLGVLAKTPPDGGRPELDVPLSVQNGKLSAGPVNVLSVPRISWN